jgi:hypothetical protein
MFPSAFFVVYNHGFDTGNNWQEVAITGNEWHFLARIGKLWQTRLKTRTSADRYHALTLLTARNELRASTDGEQFVRYARVITTAP